MLDVLHVLNTVVVLFAMRHVPRPSAEPTGHLSVNELGIGALDDVSVKRRFKELARLSHPDVCTDPAAIEKFQALTAEYSQWLAASRRSSHSGGTTKEPSVKQSAAALMAIAATYGWFMLDPFTNSVISSMLTVLMFDETTPDEAQLQQQSEQLLQLNAISASGGDYLQPVEHEHYFEQCKNGEECNNLPAALLELLAVAQSSMMDAMGQDYVTEKRGSTTHKSLAEESAAAATAAWQRFESGQIRQRAESKAVQEQAERERLMLKQRAEELLLR